MGEIRNSYLETVGAMRDGYRADDLELAMREDGGGLGPLAKSRSAKLLQTSHRKNAVTREAIESEELLAIPSAVMLKARHLYVTRMMPVSHIAQELKLKTAMVKSWSDMFDWHSMRKEREFRIYSKISKIRSRVAPNIDNRQDSIFASLEGLIEDTVSRMAEQPAVDPDDIKSLVAAMKTIQESRRIIHKKEGPVSRKKVDISIDSSLFDQLLTTVSGLAADPLHRVEVLAKDAAYEVVDDLEEAANPKKYLETSEDASGSN
jgi:hypothetical protein